jgi:hypothetical protein
MKEILLPRSMVAIAVIITTFAAFVLVAPVDRARAQYKGDENHVVSLDAAKHYIQNFKNNPVAPTTKGGYFGRNIFDKILAQAGTVGIRYYYAANDDGTPTLVLVGVDSTGSDLVQGVIGEVVYPCPPYCSSSSALTK